MQRLNRPQMIVGKRGRGWRIAGPFQALESLEILDRSPESKSSKS
jgi:hypothetical protein